MGLPINSYADFEVGRFSLPLSQLDIKHLNAYILETEQDILNALLGCELAALFIADLDNDKNPQQARFKAIYEPFCEEEDDHCIGKRVESKGIKDMLKGFTFFYYGREFGPSLSSVGPKSTSSENSADAKLSSTNLIRNYNRSVSSYRAIQYRIEDNKEDYPEYKGTEKKFISWL